jgi:hypothetical protein
MLSCFPMRVLIPDNPRSGVLNHSYTVFFHKDRILLEARGEYARESMLIVMAVRSLNLITSLTHDSENREWCRQVKVEF